MKKTQYVLTYTDKNGNSSNVFIYGGNLTEALCRAAIFLAETGLIISEINLNNMDVLI